MASKALSGKNDSSYGKDSQGFTYASAVASPRPLEERSPPVSSSNEENFPIEAAEPAQHIHRKVSHHHCMYADLWRHNYVKKFEELVKCEQKTHLNILQAKCSGNCTLVVTDAPPHKNDAEPSYVQYGHLIGLSDDQIAYVSQSADRRNGVIIKAKNRENEVCRAAILRSNFSHTDTKLYIAFDEDNKIKVWQRFKDALTQKQRVKVHVKFDLKNSYFRNLSQSVHRVSQAIIVKIMPDAQTTCTLDHENLQLEKHLPSSNFSEDQMQALKMILSSSSNGPPCLITGPFGTGKSHLLAAAAYWLFNESRNAKKPARILVCTQQRESTDNFCSLFRDFMLGDKEATIFIVRDYGFHNPKLRKWYRTVSAFKEYMGNFESKEMENFLIIMPCLTSLSVQKANFLPSDFFTHIFIDEAAQMREPEAIAPLSMASENTKVVIAGDPWQVGPSMLVLGEEARKHGLAVSLLERLLSSYHSPSSPPDFKKMVSFLDRCHRCHKDILNLSAHMFYKTDLKIPENEPLINHPKFPCPILFVCSSINETEVSKTTRNFEEAKLILEYALRIKRNWSKRVWGGDYHLDMCAMSPSRSQLTVILELIKSDPEKYSSKLTEIRRVPTFFMQGKEYKVLLLSTSEPMTRNGASANPTKSLCNPYVFNTAITRAQSLVVCVGNPFLLLRMEANMMKNPEYKEIGKCWSNYFKYCLENGTMEIPESLGVPKDKREAIFLKIKGLAEKQLQEKIQYPPHTDIEEEIESQSTVFADTSQSMISQDVSTTDVESKTVEPISNEENSIEVQSPPELEIRVPLASEPPKELLSPSASTSEFETNYEFEGSLGGGGFGIVFRVKYILDKCDYALKVIPLPEEDGKQEKLLREIVALAQLDHVHIVRYYHSWKERAPENWQDRQGWEEMRSCFLSFAKKISSSSTAATQSIARSSQTPGTSVVDSVSFRQSPQMTRKETISPQSSTNPSIKSRQVHSSTQISTVSLATLTSADSHTLLNRLCESPPTCLFIRMELCKEETLKDLLAKCSKENTRKKKDMFDYFEQMLSALSYIHGKNFIHRDLKPSNIFFSREEGRLKIGDFGLVTTGITNDPMALYSEKKSRYQAGTPTYASPEQLSGGLCSAKADIYTLGLICFELHFICKTSMEKMKVFTALRSSDIRFPKEFPKRIYQEIPDLIEQMLASEPSARPSAKDILGSDKFKELKKKENRKKAAKQPFIPLL